MRSGCGSATCHPLVLSRCHCVCSPCRSPQMLMQQCQPHWSWPETRSCFSARHCRTHRMTQGMGLLQRSVNADIFCMRMADPPAMGQAYQSDASSLVTHLKGPHYLPVTLLHTCCLLAICLLVCVIPGFCHVLPNLPESGEMLASL